MLSTDTAIRERGKEERDKKREGAKEGRERERRARFFSKSFGGKCILAINTSVHIS